MEKIKQGVEQLFKNVETTYGPLGRNVIIHTPDGELLITKDGVTVANNTNNEDPEIQAGISIVREAANKTLDQAGDGTSSTVILASKMILNTTIPDDCDINKLRQDANEAVQDILKILKDKVKYEFDLKGIAKTSANGDEEIANNVADIINHCGIDGEFKYEQSLVADKYTLTNGYKFGRGYMSPKFINNVQDNSFTFDGDVNVLIVNEKLEKFENIAKIFVKGVPLVVIAEDFSMEFLNNCLTNFKKGIFIIPIKLPEFGEQRQFFLEDLAIYTASEITTYDKITSIQVGWCTGVKINQDYTILYEPDYDSEFDFREFLKDRIKLIQNQLKETAVEFKIKKLKERLSSLSGKHAVIQIYGATDSEFKERLDLYDDALKACQNSLKYGVLPGGGLSFAKIPHYLKKDIESLEFTKLGYYMVIWNLSTLMHYAYKGKLDASSYLDDFFEVYDVKSGKRGNALNLNILDSYKTVECTLINATSVALSILTSNLYINSFRKDV
jgi:chaperonin GroEL